MSSDRKAAKRPRATAAEKRRQCAQRNWFERQMELAEERLRIEQPDLYKALATATLPELEQLAALEGADCCKTD